MTWTVVDPKYAMDSSTKVVRVDMPYFPDEIDYEGMLEKGIPPEHREEFHRATILLATPPAYEKLEQLMGGGWGDVPEMTVREETRKLCLERQAVVLKWVPVQ